MSGHRSREAARATAHRRSRAGGGAGFVLGAAASLSLGGCGGQRAVALTVDVESSGERLCVGASHPRLPAPLRFGFALSSIEPPYSLTFLAGEDVSDSIQLAGWTLEGMRTRGRGASSVVFPDRGAAMATIRVRACDEHPLRTRGARPGGTFAVLRSPPRVIAGDLDADGRDELFAIGEDGSLQVLDAEDPSRGSTRRTDLATLDGSATDLADLDGDCAYEIVAASSTGALVVDGATGGSPAPVGPPAREVRMGAFAPAGAPGLVVASDMGLLVVEWPSGASEPVLADAVTSLDVRPEAGLTRVVASGPAGTSWLRFAAGVRRDETSLLTPDLASATGPAALADLDASGGIDLVVAEGSALRMGLAGLSGFESSLGPDLGVRIVRVLAADLDGDCIDDLVVRGEDGVWAAYAGPDARPFATPSLPSLDVITADVDGDGEIEVAILGPGGRITLWSP